MKNEHDITSLLLYANSSISAEINSNVLDSLSRNALCHIKTKVNEWLSLQKVFRF